MLPQLWFSKAFCESMIGRIVRSAFEKSEVIKWMVEGTLLWDINMSSFGERIIKLMKAVKKSGMMMRSATAVCSID